MRNLFLAAVAALGLAGAATAQYPAPVQPVQPASGVNVVKGSGGCTNCGTPAVVGPTTRAFTMSKLAGKGDGCGYGQACNSGCGSLKSDLAFGFGSCKDFFSPCGPKCPKLPFAQPHGTGWQCPRQYDSYANH
jgi:hypothetical protein